MLRPALYTGMHSTFWDTLASTRRMSRGASTMHHGCRCDDGPGCVPLARSYVHARTESHSPSRVVSAHYL